MQINLTSPLMLGSLLRLLPTPCTTVKFFGGQRVRCFGAGSTGLGRPGCAQELLREADRSAQRELSVGSLKAGGRVL